MSKSHKHFWHNYRVMRRNCKGMSVDEVHNEAWLVRNRGYGPQAVIAATVDYLNKRSRERLTGQSSS